MCGSKANAGRCQQNPAVPLICPLDIQGACESSVFGDIIRQSETTSNTGLVNFNWRAQIEGSSLLLGIFLGFLLTIIVQFLVRYIKKRKQQGRWPRGLPMQMPWWSQAQPVIPTSPITPPPPVTPSSAIVMSPQVQFAAQPHQVQPHQMLPPPLLRL